jgi:hypothetical protein
VALHEDLVIPQGKSWTGPMWALLAPDDGPYDLTGKVVRAQVRESPRSQTVLYEWSTTAGTIAAFTGVVVEMDDGTTVTTSAIALTVKPSVSAAWSWRVGVYDVEVDEGGDTVWPVVEPSAVRLTLEVTR